MGILKTPYEGYIPPLATEEFEALKKDIEINGVLVPIVIDEDFNILDGHHRYKIDNNAPRRTISGLSQDEKIAYVLSSNMNRRNLSPEQKKEILKKMKMVALKLKEAGKTQDEIAVQLKVSQKTIHDWITTNIPSNNGCIFDSRVKLPEGANEIIVQKLEEGITQAQIAADFGVTQQTVSKRAKKETEKNKKKEEREKLIAERKASGIELDGVRLILGDMNIVGSELEDNSIDLIITDPPYPAEYLHCWGELAKLAARVLKPSCFLIAYSGQLHIPEVINKLNIEGLHYYWTISLIHGGTNQLINARDVKCGWKPLFVFQKDPFKKKGFIDVIQGTGREKDEHKWQQAVDELNPIIETFTIPGDLILDPFAGGGTTLVAAKKNNRKSIGIEIKEETYNSALGRLYEL